MSAEDGANDEKASTADGGRSSPGRQRTQNSTPHSRGHRKSSSWNSPPPPPFDFNPPPDFALSSTGRDSPAGVTTPSHSAPASGMSSPPWGPPSPASPFFDPAPVSTDDLLTRPQIRAIQRLSAESVHQNSSRSSSGRGGASSDGGDVLAARRDELVSHLLTGDLVPGPGACTPDVRPGTPSGEIPSSFNIGAPEEASSPSSSSSSTDDGSPEVQPLAAPPRPRSSSRSEESVHAWDSVWPAANAAHHVNLPPDVGTSRFPMAPMSPYVTPSFSPAVIQTTRRPSSSPPQSPALPRFFGDAAAATSELQRPGSSHRVLQARGSGGFLAARSESASPHSPISSPRLAPVASPTPPPPTSLSPSPCSTSSPVSSPGGSGSRRRSFVSSGPPSLSRSQTSPTTPPGWNNNSHPRAERSSSFFSNQFPELAPPFISRRELATKASRLTRRSSETAISRPRPNASSLAGDSLTMSAVLPTPSTSDNILSPSSTLTSGGSLLSPPSATRPRGPRRALSAQDTLAGTSHGRLRLAGLSMTPEQSPCSSSTSEQNTPDTPPSLPLASPPEPSPSALYLNHYGTDDSAIEDDIEEEPSVEDDAQRAQLSRIQPPTPLHRYVDGSLGGLVDEGDMLPPDTGIFDADVTFDDEGLSTLERIFLLSRSEYAFHRAYVARVLGELLGDVDPCEAVEYVLPLLSGFSLDEDDTVKEAFAADLHRILWYFFTTCELALGEEPPVDDDEHLESETLDGENFDGGLPESIARLERAIRTPLLLDVPRGNVADESTQTETASTDEQRGSESVRSNVDTLGLASSGQVDTPITNMSASLSSVEDKEWETYPPLEDDKAWATGSVERVDPPVLCVGFFRPLLGTLLLSHNPSIADPVRAGIIAIIDRLRGYSELTVETWGASINDDQPAKRRTFLSQTGPHHHVMPIFDEEARHMVEDELLQCIVLGMGKLSTEVPESLFDNSVEVVGGSEDDYAMDREREEELYRQQMIHEATLGRALSLSFIGSICEMYSPDEVLAYGFVDEVIRGLDGDATTRAEAALAMSYVVKAAPEECMESLLPVFHLFAEDEDDQVRQSACACLPALCKRFKELEDRRAFAVNSVTSFVHGSENTRYAVLEALGEVIYSFHDDPAGPPQEIIDIFCDDEESKGMVDSDWDVIASFNFPGVCLTLGSKGWHQLRSLFHRLVERAGERVFRTVSAFLHEVANILEPEQVAEDVLPVYRKCLAEGDEVRERIFEHIDVLVRSLPPSLGWLSFRRLAEAWNEDALGGWRAREQLTLHFPSFLETFRNHAEVAAVLDITRSALLDPFAAVRDAATYAVPRTYEILQDSKDLSQKFYNTLLSLSHSPRYRQRVTFVRCLREFMRPPPNRKAFEEFFVPALLRLATDIVDVRLALATALADLFIVGAFYGDKAVPVPSAIKEIISILARDEAVDVRNAVIEVGADTWSNESSPAKDILDDKMDTSPNPEGLESKMDEALASESSEAQPIPQHDRAVLAPELEEEDAAISAMEGTPDPFEASFARAASVASARSGGSGKE